MPVPADRLPPGGLDAAPELRKLYFSDGVKGGGLAARVLGATREWLRARAPPGAPLFASVWSENHRALAFYAKHGFSKVCEYEYVVGDARDREFIMGADAC